MLDFENKKILKLHQSEKTPKYIEEMVSKISGEEIIGTYKTIIDSIIFTTKRLIIMNIDGPTGLKKEITVLPYKAIQILQIKTAGLTDIDSELKLWFNGIGPVTLEFTTGTNIKRICEVISYYTI